MKITCNNGHECEFELGFGGGKPGKLKISCRKCKIKETHEISADEALGIAKEFMAEHHFSEHFRIEFN